MPALLALFLAAAAPDAAFEQSRRPVAGRVEVRVTAVVLEAGIAKPQTGDGELRRQVRTRANNRSTVEFE
jgi:hypothetical protein